MHVKCIVIIQVVLIAVVRFSNKVIRAVESEGLVSFTIISSVPSDSPFTVQVCTRGIVPLSAEGLLKLACVCSCHIYCCIHF